MSERGFRLMLMALVLLCCGLLWLALQEQALPEEPRPQWYMQPGDLNATAMRWYSQGKYARALATLTEAHSLYTKLYPEKQFPDGHPDLATSLNNLGALLVEMGEYARAKPYLEQALAMNKRLYPQGHPDLVAALTNLGILLGQTGDDAGALRCLTQALAIGVKPIDGMGRKGETESMARSLNNLGIVLQKMRKHSTALPYLKQALAVNLRLYPQEAFPQGHPNLAASLNNLGVLLKEMGEHTTALPYLEQALQMRKRLYRQEMFPQGHPHLDESLNNLGVLLRVMGRHAAALRCYEQALAIRQRLYPHQQYQHGHPALAQSLTNLGALFRAREEFARALPYYEQALAMNKSLSEHYGADTPEAEALAFLASLPRTRDGYLSSAVRLQDTSASSYEQVWQSKALVSRMLQRRLRAHRLALSGSDQKRDHPERLPRLKQNRGQQDMHPRHLSQALPPDAAFIDFLRYRHFTRLSDISLRYLAWVILPGGEIHLVELGDAKPIEEAITRWREQIEDSCDTPADREAVGKRIWSPLAKYVPKNTQTIYLAPDGKLAQVPWTALPGNKPNSVLLDHYALAIVPHGPFLLEQLTFPYEADDARDRVLALGSVEYGKPAKPYAPLPGSKAELQQVVAFAGTRKVVTLTGEKATWEQLRKHLPQSRYAHLATHGFFDREALKEEKERATRLLGNNTSEVDGPTHLLGLGGRAPLSYTGLALAGANRGDRDSVITGEALLGLPLGHLRLCVLSACETGLGDLSSVDGEGVQCLQRALHLAGCRNVVASLWRVDDRATAALMANLYQQLWQEGKSPLAALRQAQLTVLHHPDLVATLTDRGPPQLNDTVKLDMQKLESLRGTKGKRAGTKLWSAFVLSGSGRR